MNDPKKKQDTATAEPLDLSEHFFEAGAPASIEEEAWLKKLAEASANKPLLGQRIDGRFVLEDELGAGGMGWVFLARHQATGGQVALKVMNPKVGPQGKLRFTMEARNAAMLTHPNTVRVLDYGQDGEHPFLVMEFLKGEPLNEVLETVGKLSLERTVLITSQILKSLWEAHDHEIVHRDIKPGNIFLINQQGTQDFVKVLDFGISHNRNMPLGVTQGILGSPSNMAPEQWEGKDVSPQTDLYAVGCLVYEMLCGYAPFYDDSLARIGFLHLHEVPRFDPYRFADTTIPLHAWIHWMMAKEPQARPLSAKHALQALQDAAHFDLSISLRPASPPRQPDTVSSPKPLSGQDPSWKVELDVPVMVVAPETNQRVRHNLPRVQGGFVGREAELAQLSGLLLEQRCNLVTVVGLGGVGKTSLIRQFAQQSLERWPGEVWFCDLTKVTSREELWHAVTQAMGLTLTQKDHEQQFIDMLKNRQNLLLLMDNFEQITHLAPDTLVTWMSVMPNITFLVSSREPLAVTDEKVLRLSPFALPCVDADLDTAMENDAVSFFVEKAAQAKPGFTLLPENLASIIELLHQLDGLPLALELAASRLAMLMPEELVARLSQRFQLLRSRRQDVSSHQTTLKDTLDWSWDLLTPWEKEGLLQCSVFHGSFTLEAAEAVLDLSAWPDAPWVMDLLQSLLDKSWLAAMDQEDGQQKLRFRFYVSIHEYILYQYAQAQQGVSQSVKAHDALTLRHAEYYCGLPLDCAPWERDFHPDNVWMKEWANLLAIAQGCHTVLAHRAALAMACYYLQYGPFQSAVDVLFPLLAEPPDDPRQHLQLVLAYAFMAQAVGNNENEPFEQVAELAQQQDDLGLRGWSWEIVGSHLNVTNAAKESIIEAFQQALALGEATGDLKLQGNAHRSLSIQCRLRGDLDQTMVHLEQALKFARMSNALVLECFVERSMGIALRLQGHLSQAADHYLRALDINILLGRQALQGWTLRNLSALYEVLGEHNKAHQLITRALELALLSGAKPLEGWSCFTLGVYCANQGQRSKALDVFTQGLRVAEEVNSSHLRGVILGEWALIDLHMQDLEAAQAAMEQSVALVEKSVNHYGLGVVLSNQVKLQHALGQPELAAQTLARAEDIYQEFAIDPRSLFGRRIQQARQLLKKVVTA